MNAPVDIVTQTLRDKVLTLTLNSPPANALSLPMIAALRAALTGAADDRGVNVIVLASAGKVFCAGHDLKEMKAHRADADAGRAYYDDLFTRCAAMMQALTNSPKPTIAMVDGIATAAGAQMVAACDLAFASARARFCTPGVNMGGFCTTPAVGLSRVMARKHVMEMLLSGDMFDADTARDFGLINRVLPVDDLVAHTTGFATRLATRAPGPIAAGKRAFCRQIEMPLARAYAEVNDTMTQSFLTSEHDEGIAAFFERRPPVWGDA